MVSGAGTGKYGVVKNSPATAGKTAVFYPFMNTGCRLPKASLKLLPRARSSVQEPRKPWRSGGFP